uniref:Uncharacterized protein n=1 Tax=Plectus sambesii TaxID=2011161 RepID=A0A914V3B4_9BILA
MWVGGIRPTNRPIMGVQPPERTTNYGADTDGGGGGTDAADRTSAAYEATRLARRTGHPQRVEPPRPRLSNRHCNNNTCLSPSLAARHTFASVRGQPRTA